MAKWISWAWKYTLLVIWFVRSLRPDNLKLALFALLHAGSCKLLSFAFLCSHNCFVQILFELSSLQLFTFGRKTNRSTFSQLKLKRMGRIRERWRSFRINCGSIRWTGTPFVSPRSNRRSLTWQFVDNSERSRRAAATLLKLNQYIFASLLLTFAFHFVLSAPTRSRPATFHWRNISIQIFAT